MDHPNIVRLYQFFEDATHYMVVMELLCGGDLLHHIARKANKTYTEERARRTMRAITKAIRYCHRHGVMHRDLKVNGAMSSGSA